MSLAAGPRKKKKLKKSRFFFKYKENSNLRKQLSKVYAGAMISQRDVQCCSMWPRRPINGCCGCAIDSALRSKMKNPIEPSPHAMGRHYWNSHHLIRFSTCDNRAILSYYDMIILWNICIWWCDHLITWSSANLARIMVKALWSSDSMAGWWYDNTRIWWYEPMIRWW